MESGKTYRSRFQAAVKEYHDGTPFIVLEPLDQATSDSVPFLNEDLVGFDLPAGASYADAQALAKAINDGASAFTYTKLR